MSDEVKESSSSVFDGIKHINDYGIEYWSARDLQENLEYSSWAKFEKVIDKAMVACTNSGYSPDDHFVQVDKMVPIGSDALREIKDFHLSRYACYLIVQNSDPTKEIVALGQTYFAVQTRRQEIMDSEVYNAIESEDEKRLYLREEMRTHNKHLAEAANRAGVILPKDYAIFQNHGYQGLYGGLTKANIHQRKGLKKSQEILDHMGSTELAANLFRATQTEEKLRREKIDNKNEANETHYQVGIKVRQTIKELGGTMPEDLPTPESVKRIERKKIKEIGIGTD